MLYKIPYAGHAPSIGRLAHVREFRYAGYCGIFAVETSGAFWHVKNRSVREKSRVAFSGSRRRNTGVKVILFDGDDTLWVTEPLYDQARAKARGIVEQGGLDGAHWESLQRTIDLESAVAFGHSKERFPNSCLQAYERLCSEAGIGCDRTIVNRIAKAAQSVFQLRAPLVPDARRTLRALKDIGFRLGLLTKGDQEVQTRRIEHSGLIALFDIISIVESKTVATVLDCVSRLGGVPSSAWLVGNSVRSDIKPALAAGLHAVWLDTYAWEFERSDPPLDNVHLTRVEQLRDALKIIAAEHKGFDARMQSPNAR